MADIIQSLAAEELQFVNWFREAAPYIHTHRGHTFVICFGGEAVQSPHFPDLIYDIALLSSLGIRLVLIHGIRPQIEECLRVRGLSSQFVKGQRITDEMALHCVKAACGEVRSNLESLLSRGLTNYPTANVKIRTASGNFITARPIGVRDGIDYGYTGEVRRVDAEAIKNRLDVGEIVLMAPLGYSPTGEIFNLLTEDVATEVAIALSADKWICLTEFEGISNQEGRLIRQLTLTEAQRRLQQEDGSCYYSQLVNAVRVCQGGVPRAHLVTRKAEGALLLELFTRDGIGTLISGDTFEHIRKASIEDVGGLLELISPLEEMGILVRRSRDKLESEINYFTIQERDGMIIACAALYPFFEEQMAELACLAVHGHYRGEKRGDALLAFLEREAQQSGITKIFVLTTQTAHWFQERGFVAADLESLPMSRRVMYNYQRKSKVFVKQLAP